MGDPVRKNRKNGETATRNSCGEKMCIRCEGYFSEDSFSSHGATVDRKQPYCKYCVAERLMIRNYKVDKSEFEKILEMQGGVCAICESSSPDGNNGWHMDHDHSCCPGPKTCGECVRGILCSSCNKGLGHFRDSEKILEKAIWYINREIARIENGKA